jgi:hypothetical protein
MVLGLGGPKTSWGGFGTGELGGREVGCGASELKGGSGWEDGEPYESMSKYPNDENLFKLFWDFSFFHDLIEELLPLPWLIASANLTKVNFLLLVK